MPGIAEEPHPKGVPVCVKRGLCVEEVEIRAHAVEDQLGGEKMEPFIPGESVGLGIED
jgi:hypothetical protein